MATGESKPIDSTRPSTALEFASAESPRKMLRSSSCVSSRITSAATPADNSLARSRACCLSTQNAIVCRSSPRFFQVLTTSPKMALWRIAIDNSFGLNSRARIDTSSNASLIAAESGAK